jgi:hypothetical protein
MRLGVRVGDGCAALHDRLMRDLHVNLLEFDEVWSFIGKKQKRLDCLLDFSPVFAHHSPPEIGQPPARPPMPPFLSHER